MVGAGCFIRNGYDYGGRRVGVGVVLGFLRPCGFANPMGRTKWIANPLRQSFRTECVYDSTSRSQKGANLNNPECKLGGAGKIELDARMACLSSEDGRQGANY